MFKKFIYLEWKAFFRSASLGKNLAMKILMGFLVIYFSVAFIACGIALFYGVKKELHTDPLLFFNKYLIYYFLVDLIVRLLLQNIPVLNIRPLLVLPINKTTIVNFSLGKTALSFFNWVHAFLFIPFTIVLLLNGYSFLNVLLWHISIVSLIYINNFLNIILNNKDRLFTIFIAIIVVAGACQYYHIFDITSYSEPFFNGLYQTNYMFLIPVFTLIGLYYYSFKYFKSELFLDAGLASKHDIAKTENLAWLNQFGSLGIFLKNDIKLIKRNKRAKTTVGMAVFFLFYGLFIFTQNANQSPIMHILGGIFVSGGFLFTFGQFVPSWDSAYYPLMMTQNIPYKNYLSSKWWLVVIATAISTLLASAYIFMGWHVYLCIVVGAIYNIGVNSHLVLLAGAYTKTPIDLASSKGAFGDKKAFNVQTMLIALPKVLLPVLLYGLGLFLYNANTGLAFVTIAGVLGFAFRNKVFTIIEKVYKSEKYKTIDAYKQKS
jgi:hypothetical protein